MWFVLARFGVCGWTRVTRARLFQGRTLAELVSSSTWCCAVCDDFTATIPYVVVILLFFLSSFVLRIWIYLHSSLATLLIKLISSSIRFRVYIITPLFCLSTSWFFYWKQFFNELNEIFQVIIFSIFPNNNDKMCTHSTHKSKVFFKLVFRVYFDLWDKKKQNNIFN